MTQLDELVSSKERFVVAVEPDPVKGEAVLFFREEGKVRSERREFHPFMLLRKSSDLGDFEGAVRFTELAGTAEMRFLAEFESVAAYNSALDFLKRKGRDSSMGARTVFGDLATQIMLALNLRLYRGMEFGDLKRVQFDIETVTTAGFNFPNASRAGDEVVIISLADSQGHAELLHQGDGVDEKALLQAFIARIAELDPDVIEGHNICRFDLPYLEERCRRHGLKLALGRDGSALRKRNSFFNAAERTVNYTRFDCYGRSVVDTLHLAQFYDVIHRSLDSFNLKYLAKYFNVAPPDRTYVDGGDISDLWRSDRATLLAYAQDDALECRGISSVLLPSYFFMAQLVPLKLQDCVIRGKATVIDYMLTSAYLGAKTSIPLPEPAMRFAGALTVSPREGIFREVYHCDVRSLYPSIILAEEWSPARDTLKEFIRLLRKLREFRLAARDAMKNASSPGEREFYKTLQSTFKILINSFYGYLGSAQSNFNDFKMAERITSRGREILQSMLDFLTANSCTVLEADTDGVYFTLPTGNAEPAENWERKVQSILPPGITIELDAHYPAMFCYKSKNYALLAETGAIEISGAALKSRGLEPFQREFMELVLKSLLNGEPEKIAVGYRQMEHAIETGTMPTAKLAKSETLKDSLAVYRRKLESGEGRRSAAYELAANSGSAFRPGDQVTYYVTGVKKSVPVHENAKMLALAPEVPDYNRAYYLNKLGELYKKFATFIPTGNAGNPVEGDLFS